MPSRIKLFGRKPFNRKPFNCEYCLPIYTTMILYVLPEAATTVIAGVFGAAVFTTFILKLTAKWKL